MRLEALFSLRVSILCVCQYKLLSMIDCGEAAGHRHKQCVTVFYNQRVQIRVVLVTV